MPLSLCVRSTFALIVVVTLFSGCTKKTEPEGYRVVSYDGTTHQWVILRNGTFDGKYLVKRLTAVCSSYKHGEGEGIKGPEACHLQVGRLMIPNPFPQKRNEFLDIFEMPGVGDEILAINEGDGADQVTQLFTILKHELLPDKPNR